MSEKLKLKVPENHNKLYAETNRRMKNAKWVLIGMAVSIVTLIISNHIYHMPSDLYWIIFLVIMDVTNYFNEKLLKVMHETIGYTRGVKDACDDFKYLDEHYETRKPKNDQPGAEAES